MHAYSSCPYVLSWANLSSLLSKAEHMRFLRELVIYGRYRCRAMHGRWSTNPGRDLRRDLRTELTCEQTRVATCERTRGLARRPTSVPE